MYEAPTHLGSNKISIIFRSNSISINSEFDIKTLKISTNKNTKQKTKTETNTLEFILQKKQKSF